MNKYKIPIILSFLCLWMIYIEYIKLNLKVIPIAFSLNNNYVYPLIVLLTSILYNSLPDVFFRFYLLLSPDIEEKNLNKILEIHKKYINCKISLIYMKNKYSDFAKNIYKSVAVYYRLELSNVISDVNKIIYLDIDTIVHKDLTEFYNIDIGNYYYMGFPANDLTKFEFNGTRNYINSGVMLINLKKLREINATLIYQEYYKKFGTKKVDEYLINVIFYDKIKFLPLKYGIPDFNPIKKALSSPSMFLRTFKNLTNFTDSDMIYASKNRVITHGSYDLSKWWDKKYSDLTDIGKEWLFYASKSIVFNEICSIYTQFMNYCDKIKSQA